MGLYDRISVFITSHIRLDSELAASQPDILDALASYSNFTISQAPMPSVPTLSLIHKMSGVESKVSVARPE
jgi:hypothetical protein